MPINKTDELEAFLENCSPDEMSTYGLVLELNLRKVVTLSVGQITIDDIVISYHGTQRLTKDNEGRPVYGGSDLVCVRGGWQALAELPMSAEVRLGVDQARTYEAAMRAYPGFMASRRNYDVGQGLDAQGKWRSGVLESFALGTPLAWWLARHSFRGKWALEAIILMALLTPPLAMGILLTTLCGPYGPVGSLVTHTGVELTNSPPAFVLAQFYGALPYYVVAARAAFEGVPRELEHIALTLGKSPWQTFWLISMPLARLGLAAGIALAWVRALGEFGIVLILAYYPQGIPVKLWVNLQDIGLSAVYPLLWVFFLVAMPLPLILGLASRRQGLF